MSKTVYQVAVIETATDMDGVGEIKMQQAILDKIKELNNVNPIDARFEALPVNRRGFYGSHILSTQFAVALGELNRDVSVRNAEKVHAISMRMHALAGEPLPVPNAILRPGA